MNFRLIVNFEASTAGGALDNRGPPSALHHIHHHTILYAKPSMKTTLLNLFNIL
jgi:hypothetical protein